MVAMESLLHATRVSVPWVITAKKELLTLLAMTPMEIQPLFQEYVLSVNSPRVGVSVLPTSASIAIKDTTVVDLRLVPLVKQGTSVPKMIQALEKT
jgi:hypothetical protein